MVNKKLSVLIGVFMMLLSCKQEKLPAGIIEKEKMINLLVDMQIVDAYLNQVANVDTMLLQAKSRYTYIFKKHAIDSVKFSRSLNYYSLRSIELNEMYQTVIDSLEHMKERAKPKPQKVKRVKKVNKAK
jgi:hypothetical protein